ncbi:hypothetical protein TrRE_jg13254 [Triparma retinervis]|uniref:Uncharacterized protein n=1 Tax=Triparma retinervis TaxID=2557542 RepID=A0A9W7C9M4_9STRA|nr:hypothetical protein TrRE_jg13254 [Triparma retinervis]
METVEALRRKHISTLEVLQKLSDENAELKARLESVGENGGTSEVGRGEEDVQVIMEMREEVKKLQEELGGKNAEAKKAFTERDKAKDLYDGERRLVRKLKREMEVQGNLMEELRKELQGFREREEGEGGGEGAGGDGLDERERELFKSKISILETHVEELKSKVQEEEKRGRERGEEMDGELRASKQREAEAAAALARVKEEKERLGEENKALGVEIQRVAEEGRDANGELGRSKKELEGSKNELKGERKRREEAERNLENLVASKSEARGALPPSPAAVPEVQQKGGKREDFGAFVALKKENHALRMQVSQLMDTLTGRRKR